MKSHPTAAPAITSNCCAADDCSGCGGRRADCRAGRGVSWSGTPYCRSCISAAHDIVAKLLRGEIAPPPEVLRPSGPAAQTREIAGEPRSGCHGRPAGAVEAPGHRTSQPAHGGLGGARRQIGRRIPLSAAGPPSDRIRSGPAGGAVPARRPLARSHAPGAAVRAAAGHPGTVREKRSGQVSPPARRFRRSSVAGYLAAARQPPRTAGPGGIHRYAQAAREYRQRWPTASPDISAKLCAPCGFSTGTRTEAADRIASRYLPREDFRILRRPARRARAATIN